MSRTLTSTVTAAHSHRPPRYRSLSLSLVANDTQRNAINIHHLPSELVISIIEVALLCTKPHALATISKALHALVNHVLYRTIVLECPLAILDLHRTAVSSPHLLAQVNKLAVTWDGSGDSPCALDAEVGDIVGACHNLYTLTLPCLTRIPPFDKHNQLREITTPWMNDEESTRNLAALSSTITHLRFTEFNEFSWLSPCEMLARFGNPQSLSHLQVSRRMGANEANDLRFANEVETILSTYPNIQIVLVSIFRGFSWESKGAEAVEDSHIWSLMKNLKAVDGRVVVLEGQWDEWSSPFEGFHPMYGANVASTFWNSL